MDTRGYKLQMSTIGLPHHPTLNEEQELAFQLLSSGGNVFLTGSAGTGKSFLVRHYLRSLDNEIPVLASTGAAAVIIGGRTFHSYFGLGILSGGVAKTVEKAAKNPKVYRRIERDHTILIDEISMISPEAFGAAHLVAQKIRRSDLPFGGLRLIVVGDFLQLPPVNPHRKAVDWLFATPLWKQMGFQVAELTKSMRTDHEGFVRLLNHIRFGKVTSEVTEFLGQRVCSLNDKFDGTVLFPRKYQAEAYNLSQLRRLKSETAEIRTEVIIRKGVRQTKDQLLALAPLPEVLTLKKGALIMFRKNDPDFKFVNGSLGKVKAIHEDRLHIDLLTGDTVELKKEDFHILGGDGEILATIRNFPVTLAWATTIHKSQGASIDRVFVNLNALWECGQAYVALSRAKSPDGLFVEEWDASSIKADQTVVRYYSNKDA